MFNETLEFYCFFSQKENLDSNIPHSISFSFRALSSLAFHYEKSRYLLILIIRHSRNMRVLIASRRRENDCELVSKLKSTYVCVRFVHTRVSVHNRYVSFVQITSKLITDSK